MLPPVPAPRTKKKNKIANENKNISFVKEPTTISNQKTNIFEAAYVSQFNITENSNDSELIDKLNYKNSYEKFNDLENDYMIHIKSSVNGFQNLNDVDKFKQIKSTDEDNCFSNLKDELQEDDDSGVYTSDSIPPEAKGSDNVLYDTIKIGDFATLESIAGQDKFNADCLTGSMLMPYSHNINENFDFKQNVSGGALPISSTEYDKYFLIDVSQDGDNNSASSEVLTNKIIKNKYSRNSLEVSVHVQGEPSVLPIFYDVCSELNVSLENSKHVTSISTNKHPEDVKVEFTSAVESDLSLKTTKEMTVEEKTADECDTVLQVGSPFEAPKFKEQSKPKDVDIGSIFETYTNDLVVDGLENNELRPKDICVMKTDHYSNISKDFSLFISNMLNDKATNIVMDNISISQNSNFVNKTNIFNNDSLEVDKCIDNSCFVVKSHLKEDIEELFADCNDSNFSNREENILNIRNAALNVDSNENFNISNVFETIVGLDNCCEDKNNSQTKEHIDASEQLCQLENIILSEDMEKVKSTISDSFRQSTITDMEEKTDCMLPEDSQITQNLDHKIGDNLWESDCGSITINSKCSLPSFESFIAKSSNDKVTKFSYNSRSNSPFEIMLDNNLWNNLQRSNSSAQESDCEYHNSITIPNRSFVS